MSFTSTDKVKGLRLYKREKLCSLTAIDSLFMASRRSSNDTDNIEKSLVYPLRMVWARDSRRSGGSKIQFLVSIPKKRVRHAVDRVTMRRRVREAYRLNRLDFDLDPDTAVNVVFIWVANGTVESNRIHKAMKKLLAILAQRTATVDES